MRALRRLICVVAAIFVVNFARADDSQRVNLWPVFYYDPPDSMTCFPLFARDRTSFYSLPFCCGEDFVVVPPTLSWYSQSANGLENYLVLGGLLDVSFKGEDYAKSWLLPLYYHDRTKFVTPLVGWGDDFETIPVALSWHEKSAGSDAYRALLGLGGASWSGGIYDQSWLFPLYYHDREKFLSLAACWDNDYCLIPAALSWYRETNDQTDYRVFLGLGGVSFSAGSYDRSWLLPLYYHDAHQFLSPLVGWGETFEALPALLSWHSHADQRESYLALLGLGGLSYRGGEYWNSWLFPLFYHAADGRFLTLPFGCKPNGWSVPALLTFHTTEKDGSEKWVSAPLLSSVELQNGEVRSIKAALGMLFDAKYESEESIDWSVLSLLAKYKKTAEHQAFISLLPYSYWMDKANHQVDFYGYCLLHSTGENYSRWSLLWKFFDCVNEKGNLSIDAFPGVTYDASADGTVDFSFWYRLFRYRATPRGLTDLSIFFIPFNF